MKLNLGKVLCLYVKGKVKIKKLIYFIWKMF